MIKIAVIGVITAVLAAWLKNVKAEYGVWMVLAAGVFLSMATVLKVDTIVQEIKFLQGYFSGYGAYFKILLKVIGITYLAEFSCALGKDAGANTLASQIELFGKLSILVLCMPIMTSLLETIDYFLGG